MTPEWTLQKAAGVCCGETEGALKQPRWKPGGGRRTVSGCGFVGFGMAGWFDISRCDLKPRAASEQLWGPGLEACLL